MALIPCPTVVRSTRRDTTRQQRTCDHTQRHPINSDDTSNPRIAAAFARALGFYQNAGLSPKWGRGDNDYDSDLEEEGTHTPRASESSVGNRSRSARSSKKISPSRVSISTSSSPSRKLDSLSLDADGIVTRQLGFGDKRHPVVLKQMLSKVLEWSKWKGILSSSMRQVFGHDLSEHGLDEDDAYSKVPDDYGISLSPNAVDEILGHASPSSSLGEGLSGWGASTSSRYYFMCDTGPPLYTPTGNPNTSISHSATITKEYLPTAAGSKLVDFCVYVNPEAGAKSGENYTDRVNKLRRSLPMLCMNHTSYLGLKAEPISISLETKRSGDDEDNATLQIGTWQAAQWNYLKYLLQNGEYPSPFHQLPRLPTQSHFFPCTNSQQILWAKFPFGDTTSLAGVYTIATAVQYLRHWTATVYWEWFKRNILDITLQAPI
ncbi:uncharacterized protein NECHADRAFT_88038 [Fusarium vanettenii 77-13-4]|uniref:PD-(D/E)XK nuclease-like domain-containing protein n=1 Tax=Fusarium vanettenii (strain ATCC MYA-4622 / CBS 123669 / FGSC 9596 / NRRL 45880 / 77-13-4) TaxID=660122 RepID=C7ZPU4_FUSV7|nr:uncharacterized protein NECHADRAFT_88038 [Fusarium vanettenii 77-13-4]EEU33967.1 predicted protein [Fusarium vanettenii 77-13-4]